MKLWAYFFCVVVLCGAAVGAGPKIEKAQVSSGGAERTYYLFVPEKAHKDPAPLLLLLHGSGRTGETLVKAWQGEAEREGIILVGPDANKRENWDSRVDSPDYLRDVIIDVMAHHDVDPQRLYVFGHSAGAMYGIILGLLESKYFAAVGAHAGALHPEEYVLMNSAERKIPIGLWSGEWDETVPIEFVRKTEAQLREKGFPTYFNPLPKHTHDYNGAADVINYQVWNFLKDKRNENPEFTHYDWAKPKQLAPLK